MIDNYVNRIRIDHNLKPYWSTKLPQNNIKKNNHNHKC